MTDSHEVNAIDTAIPLLQDFINSENYRLLQIHEKREFDKILNFMAEQIKREQQGKTVDPQKFNQELTKKLNHFNRVAEYDATQELVNAGLIKKQKVQPKQQAEEKLRKMRVKGAVIEIVQKIPKPVMDMPKRASRPRRIIDNVVRRVTGKSSHLRNHVPLIFHSGLSRDNTPDVSQKRIQAEFGQYAEQLITYANKKYGNVSNIFSEYLPTEQKKQQYPFPSLTKQSNVQVGDFIERAHHYPEEPNSRDQLVIRAMARYEDKHYKDTKNELMDLSHSIAGINSLRTKIDKIYTMLKETPPRKDLIDQIALNISLVKPEAEILAESLNKIQDPEIKKMANQALTLANKIIYGLPKDIKHKVEAQQAREEQLLAPRKKPGSPAHK